MASLDGVDLVTAAFAFFNMLRLTSYFPQIIAIARDRDGARSISFMCWSIWVGANASTAAYAWLRLGDAGIALISIFNATCCLVVIALAAYKRLTSGKSMSPQPAGLVEHRAEQDGAAISAYAPSAPSPRSRSRSPH